MTQAEQEPKAPKSQHKTSSTKKAAAKGKTTKAAAAKKTAKKAAPKAKQNGADASAASPEPADAASAKAAPPPKKPLYEDFDALTEYVADITGKSQEVIQDFFANNPAMRNGGEMSADPLNLSESFAEMMKGLAADPGALMQRQFTLWNDYANMMANMSRRFAGEDVAPTVAPEKSDRRFSHPAWNDNPMLDYVKQSYLLFSRFLEGAVHDVKFDDEHDKAKAEFYTKQFIDAVAPTNFAMLNPEVVEATVESKGENLLKGLKNLLDDMERGNGQLSIRQADLDYFKLGENIATTPGKVVYQNDLIQLIQYTPTTEKVGKLPLLIIPPWINKYYILDLQPNNSFIKWVVDQGRTLFVVSWVNPGPELSGKTFEDYIHEGLYEALDAVAEATGEEKADTIGYCIGGTMLSAALALMKKKGDKRVNSATFFTAQADFSEPGDLRLFIDDEQLAALEKQMDAAGGVLEGRAMATTFNMLRANDLIWTFVIDNYMKGKDPAKFDLLFWNSDSTRMPKTIHMFYLREFYQKNALAKGEMVIEGETLNIGDVDIPIFMQAGEKDHIAPPASVYKTARLFASGKNDKVMYMLAGSGHIAGVVNHPDKHKYHHSTNAALPATLDEWKKGAEREPGSWWPFWIEWLRDVSPGEVPARQPGGGKLKIIEDAPGSYVKVKS